MDKERKNFKISEKTRQKLQNIQDLKNELMEGKTAQEALEFSDATLSFFYHSANLLFERQRYQEAGDAFLFLAALNPYHHEYWLGLGMATQMSHDYEAAIDAYELASLCEITNPVPYFYLAKCLFAIHDRENALQALDLSIEMAEAASPEFDELKLQAEHAKEILLDHDK